MSFRSIHRRPNLERLLGANRLPYAVEVELKYAVEYYCLSPNGTMFYLVFTTGVASWVGPCATILCLNARKEVVSIPSRTIDDCLRIIPAGAGDDNPLLWNNAFEGSIDMVTHAPNVPVTRPNLVGVLAGCYKPELLVPRVIFPQQNECKTQCLHLNALHQQ